MIKSVVLSPDTLISTLAYFVGSLEEIIFMIVVPYLWAVIKPFWSTLAIFESSDSKITSWSASNGFISHNNWYCSLYSKSIFSIEVISSTLGFLT